MLGGYRVKLPATVYHLAEASNFASIKQHGLLSAARLMSAAGLERAALARAQRSQRLTHTMLPSGVSIRDQRPMPPTALSACLIGLTPAQWYALLNARVFFWVDPERLNRQRAACRARPQVVLAVDSAKLVHAHAPRLALTPINTGNARRKPARRGAATFVPYAQWIESGWDSEASALGTSARKRTHAPVEVTVADAVPDIMRLVTGIHRLGANQAFAP